MLFLSLAACQMNNIHDTGGGSVAPILAVTGVKVKSGAHNQ